MTQDGAAAFRFRDLLRDAAEDLIHDGVMVHAFPSFLIIHWVFAQTLQFMAMPAGVTRKGLAGLMVLIPVSFSKMPSMPVRQQVPPHR